MGTIAARGAYRSELPERPSGVRVFFVLVFATLVTTLSTAMAAFTLDGLFGGSLVVSSGNTRPTYRFAWPGLPDSMWSRGLDVVAAIGVVLVAAWVTRITLGRFGERIPRWALVGACAAVILLPGSGRDTVAAMAGALVLVRLGPAAPPRRWPWRRQLLVAAGVAALLTVLVSGTLYAANQHPIVAAPNMGCRPIEGTGLASPVNRTESYGRPLVYAYRRGERAMPVLCLLNRAPTRTATVLGLATGQAPPGPWRLRLARLPEGRPVIGPLGWLTLRPHATGQAPLEVRFTGCAARDAGRTFTLDAVPLAVQTDGAVQVDSVPLSTAIRTRCP
jgi:hypothetical protein